MDPSTVDPNKETGALANLPPLPKGYTATGTPRPLLGPASTGAPAVPALPSGYQATSPVRQMPFGSRMSIKAGPVSMSVGAPTTTGEQTLEEKKASVRRNLLQQAQEMNDLYQKRLKDRVESGQLSSFGQGFDYTNPGWAREFGGQLDPDVKDFIIKSGAFSQALNTYYGMGGGGRPGVGYFTDITAPHSPHPPGGLTELSGLNSLWGGQQWDLQKQGEQLPILLHYLRREEGLEPTQTYQPFTPQSQTEKELLEKYGR